MLHFLYVWLGLSNASGPQYSFWSGIFSDATIFSSVVYGLYMVKKHSECHEQTCHKHGKFEFNDIDNNVKYKLCANHHPGVPTQVSHLHLIKVHKAQQDTYER